MKQYRIIAKCDPYNAIRHYNGEEVVKYDGVTPVQWVMRDGLDEAEAKEALMELAKTGDPYECGIWTWEDEKTVAETAKTIEEEFGEKADMTWYKGPGLYQDVSPILLEGETAFRDDSVAYAIEEVE